MTGRIRITALVVGFALPAAISTARADYLNPLLFPSIGTLNLAPGNYTIETNGVPVFRDAANNVLFTGTTFFQGGSFGDTISVLCFSSVNIPAGVNIRASGDNPLAILSHSTILLSGVIDAGGFNGSNSSGQGGTGAGGLGGPGAGRGGNANGGAGFGPGGGPGGFDGIGSVNAGGGAFGGRGGQNAAGAFASPYGNLRNFLQGGSGGGAVGSSIFHAIGSGGGGGGGAVELGAVDAISFVAGQLLSIGGQPGAAIAANSGGGSGGGLLIHAPIINYGINSVMRADGALFGGGGRILFLTGDGTINQTGGTITAAAGGGANNQEPGVIEFAVIPEPSSLALVALGGFGAAMLKRWRAGRR